MSWSYKFWGNVDVTNIIKEIYDLDEELWLDWREKQEVYNDVHHNTQTIPIILDESYGEINVNRGIETKFYRLFKNDLLLIERHLCSVIGNGEIIRAEIPRLKPNTNIPTHTDTGNSLIHDSRIHIPLKTSELCTFTVDGETKHMGVGELWEINNGASHSVTNDSDDYRIHLIVDFKKFPDRLF